MGQMVMAVILGVDAGEAPESLGEDGWSALLDRYRAGTGPKPAHPCGDTDVRNVIGFWVAEGDDGEDGCPPLDTSFRFDGFLEIKTYRKAYDRAAQAWERFQQWAITQGYSFGAGDLWLVLTEIA